MRIKFFLYISILLLVGCDQAQQGRMADRANKLIDPEAFCVVQYESFYHGPFSNQAKLIRGLDSNDVSKVAAEWQSLVVIHDSANLTDCPIALKSAVHSVRQGLLNMISLINKKRDNPFTFIKESDIQAITQQLGNAFSRIDGFLKVYNSDALINLKK